MRPRTLYVCLIVLRCVFALSPGYIHPDEYFQNAEPVVGDLLNIDVFRSWEFEADAPVRSMASLRLFNMPLWALAWMCKRSGTSPSAMAVFATQRLTFLALSFVSDVSIAHLLPSHPRRELTLCSFASTSAALALSVRPFSNAVESAVLTATLAAFCAFVRRPGVSPATAMGALCAVGLFARFTFAIFALPLGVLFLSDIVRRRAIGSTCAAAASFAVVALAHIWSDTAYYGTSTLVLAPVNAALYNLKTENLAQHGVHPRWLHAVVNAPMVLGLGPYAAALFGAVQFKAGFGEGDIAARASAAVIAFALPVLSAQPHQEPRFLLPLATPASILLAHFRPALSWRPWIKTLVHITLAQNLLTAIFFNVLHQAGTVPSLLWLNRELALHPDQNVSVHVWRSFMPPRHLILPGISASTDVTVFDHGSIPATDVAARITNMDHHRTHILLTPVWALTNLPLSTTILHNVWPHLDMDHLPETFALGLGAVSYSCVTVDLVL